jgi:hypothetical protein
VEEAVTAVIGINILLQVYIGSKTTGSVRSLFMTSYVTENLIINVCALALPNTLARRKLLKS